MGRKRYKRTFSTQEILRIFETVKAWYTPGMRKGKVSVNEKMSLRDLEDIFRGQIDGYLGLNGGFMNQAASCCWIVRPECPLDVSDIRRYFLYAKRKGDRGYAGRLRQQCGNVRCVQAYHQIKDYIWK